MMKLITVGVVAVAVGLYPAYAYQFVDAAAKLAASARAVVGAEADSSFSVIVLIAAVILVARWR